MCVWLSLCVSGAGRLRPFMLIKVSHWRVAGKKAGSDWPSRTHLYADSPRSHEWLSINLFHKLSGVVTARLGRTEAKKCGFVDARFRRSDGRSFVDTTLAGSCFGRRLSLRAERERERKRERVSVCVREPVCACLCVCACVCVCICVCVCVERLDACCFCPEKSCIEKSRQVTFRCSPARSSLSAPLAAGVFLLASLFFNIFFFWDSTFLKIKICSRCIT